MTTTITSKGQVVIPKVAREQRRLKPGDDLEVLLPDGTDDVILRKIQAQPNAGLVSALQKMRGLKIPARRKRFARRPPQF